MKLKRRTAQEPKPSRRPKAADVLGVPEDEPESELLFDPERDISDEQWEEQKARLEKLRGKSWDEYGEMASNLSVVFPERRHELGLDDEAFDIRKSHVEDSRDDGWFFNARACELFLMYPERKKDLGLSNETFKAGKQWLDRHYNGDWSSFGTIATWLLILYPERRDELRLDDKAFIGFKAEVEKARYTNMYGFCRYAAELTLLFPERKKELELDDAVFGNMKAEMNRDPSYAPISFSFTARNLAIIAAERIEISSTEGLKLIKKEKSLQQPQPLPTRPQI